MHVIAVFLYEPKLSDIPYACFAERKVGHTAWAIIGPFDFHWAPVDTRALTGLKTTSGSRARHCAPRQSS